MRFLLTLSMLLAGCTGFHEEARGVFDLSRKRLDERIPPEAPRDILIFMRNFYRIAGG